MTRSDLKDILDGKGVKEGAYSLYGGISEDTLCIDENYGTWSVYYAERGTRWDEKKFDSEDAACRYFLHLIEKFMRI
ncbi:MAG TPA: hypothetical protein VF444_17400 [Pseudonocardiaceae bacterium]